MRSNNLTPPRTRPATRKPPEQSGRRGLPPGATGYFAATRARYALCLHAGLQYRRSGRPTHLRTAPRAHRYSHLHTSPHAGEPAPIAARVPRPPLIPPHRDRHPAAGALVDDVRQRVHVDPVPPDPKQTLLGALRAHRLMPVGQRAAAADRNLRPDTGGVVTGDGGAADRTRERIMCGKP
ncbi:hypothetical protein GCM10023147_48740 [Tsukamurella soli]|uniref:Uncharacterized protein n=1 Tax=Tsukamurella soli TaxID=644556 RepID=A0ABP8KFF7_9ACTN